MKTSAKTRKCVLLVVLAGIFIWVFSAQMVMDMRPHPLTRAEQKEATAMSLALGGTPDWDPAALRQMLAGANWASDRLHLPTPPPIRASDLVYRIIGPPGVSVAANPLRDDFYNPDIPRETRLRALRFGVSGVIDTTNFEFGFAGGRIFHILRIDYPKRKRKFWTDPLRLLASRERFATIRRYPFIAEGLIR
ncbi:MAG TPA: hypothetical protein VG077_06180 [Verrucomicrobiae bacterium]|nr:hypothetical protein [Verrucomicrobiae bacterium]